MTTPRLNSRLITVALASALLASCASSESATEPGTGAQVERARALAFGGQTGSGSAPACADDDACEDEAADVQERFTHAEPHTPLLGSDCVDPGEGDTFEAGDVCACRFACRDEGGKAIGKRIGDIGDARCSDAANEDVWVGVRIGYTFGYVDRFGRNYLEGYDFEGCDPAQPSESCDEVCDELERNWHEAAAQAHEITVTNKTCDFLCENVYEVDGEACYTHLGRNLGSEAIQEGPFECE